MLLNLNYKLKISFTGKVFAKLNRRLQNLMDAFCTQFTKIKRFSNSAFGTGTIKIWRKRNNSTIVENFNHWNVINIQMVLKCGLKFCLANFDSKLDCFLKNYLWFDVCWKSVKIDVLAVWVFEICCNFTHKTDEKRRKKEKAVISCLPN